MINANRAVWRAAEWTPLLGAGLWYRRGPPKIDRADYVRDDFKPRLNAAILFHRSRLDPVSIEVLVRRFSHSPFLRYFFFFFFVAFFLSLLDPFLPRSAPRETRVRCVRHEMDRVPEVEFLEDRGISLWTRRFVFLFYLSLRDILLLLLRRRCICSCK